MTRRRRDTATLSILAGILVGVLGIFATSWRGCSASEETLAQVARIDARTSRIEDRLDSYRDFHAFQCMDDQQLLDQIERLTGKKSTIHLIADPE
jgi:hypothetical protein